MEPREAKRLFRGEQGKSSLMSNIVLVGRKRKRNRFFLELRIVHEIDYVLNKSNIAPKLTFV
ncbi:hypothetical protein EPO56_02965 [Patescibacteria group bacterium]|nr:MAG: hypothetical protein EPO56_02965 [Patescibacteria group bacterium]